MLPDLGWFCLLRARKESSIAQVPTTTVSGIAKTMVGYERFNRRGGVQNHTSRFAAQHAYSLNDSTFRGSVPSGNLTKPSGLPNRIEVPGGMPVVLQINSLCGECSSAWVSRQ